jgi:YHS domain-containing protein
MIRISVILFTLMALGCAADMPTTATAACHAQCLVCKHNADLACVDVTVDDSTPSSVYLGKRYYFCSNSCRDEFAENPAKYMP